MNMTMPRKTIKAAEIKKGDIFVNPSFGGELVVSNVLKSLIGKNEIHVSFEVGGGTSLRSGETVTVVDMDAIHAEALAINYAVDAVWPLPLTDAIEAAHVEALKLNDAFDWHIARAKYDLEVTHRKAPFWSRKNIKRGLVAVTAQAVAWISPDAAQAARRALGAIK